METNLDKRRIGLFLLIAFGFAWVVALIIFLNGGLTQSPEIITGTGITLAVVLLAAGYMFAPALANMLTRLITREGWKNTMLRPRRTGWPYWIVAWVTPAIVTIIGGIAYFAIFPNHFDGELTTFRQTLESSGSPLPISPAVVIIIQIFSGILISPLVNGLFTFGEEFGWRAYLQQKLMPLGERKAILLLGLIWGVWHWPVIAMGHNYGLEYPGYPWSGMLMMVWVTLCFGVFLGWVTMKTGSVWPAVIGHAAINGISALAIIFVKGNPNPLVGPLPVGILGSIGWAVLALLILLKPGELKENSNG